MLLLDFKDQRLDTRQSIILDEGIAFKVAALVEMDLNEPQSIKVRLRTASDPSLQSQLELPGWDGNSPIPTPRIIIFVRPIDPLSERGWYAINNSLINAFRRVVHLKSLDLAYIEANHSELNTDAAEFGHKARLEEEGASLWALRAK